MSYQVKSIPEEFFNFSFDTYSVNWSQFPHNKKGLTTSSYHRNFYYTKKKKLTR